MNNFPSCDLPNLVKTTCIQNTRFNEHVRGLAWKRQKPQMYWRWLITTCNWFAKVYLDSATATECVFWIKPTSQWFEFFTVRNEVAKVMFLHLSVCPRGVSASVHAGMTPPWDQASPGTRHPTGPGTPPGLGTPPGPGTPTPQTRHLPPLGPGTTRDQAQPPGPGSPPGADGYCCGRYASYWNAFLFFTVLRKIRWIEQKEFQQKWGLSSGYPDKLPNCCNHYTTECTLSLCKSLCSRKPFVLATSSKFRMHSRHHCY